MRTKSFDFDLPPDLIALRPAEPRDAADCWSSIPDGRLESSLAFSEFPIT